jgi:toxin ParE1/3/4
MRSARWEQRALDDLREALTYIALESRPAALMLEERIRMAVELLEKRSIGRPTRLPDVFQKAVLKTPYTIFYRVEDSQLTILSVVHQRRLRRPDDAGG